MIASSPNRLTKKEIDRINDEIEMIDRYNNLLNPDLADELEVLERNIARLSHIRDLVLANEGIERKLILVRE